MDEAVSKIITTMAKECAQIGRESPWCEAVPLIEARFINLYIMALEIAVKAKVENVVNVTVVDSMNAKIIVNPDGAIIE